jgi:caa(3)-type oxidase subunit IV
MAKNKDAQHDEHRPDVGLYVKVFAALMVLTMITVIISKFHLPRPQAIGLGLFVAVIKASLVGALFMHLWGENKLIHRALMITVAAGAILILPLIDCVIISHRITTPVDVASQHPNESAEGHENATEPIKLEAPAPVLKKAAVKKGKK